MEHIFSKLSQINTFIFDVDGVLTNGNILITEEGKLLRTMDVKDGYALKLAIDKGYKICIISGGHSEGVKIRLENLGLKDIFLNVPNKLIVFNTYIKENNIDLKNIVYMGDDLPDFHVMEMVELPTCPADACSEIKEISKYISPYNGGEGCVRDIIEKVLKVRGHWE